MTPHNIGSSLSSRKSKKRRAPRKKKMIAPFNDDQAPLKSSHSPQDGDSRIQMWVGCMLSLVTLVTIGSIYKYEHSYHPFRPSEATLASIAPSLLIPVPAVPISKVKFVIPVDLSAWQPVGDDYYYSVIPGLSWNTSLKPAAASKAVAPHISLPLTTTPCKKNISQGTLQFLKNPTVFVELATIVVCHFLWIGLLPSILTKLATSRRLRVVSTVARRVRIFKPFQKVWKGITTIYKNRSKLSVASEYTFYVEASESSAQEDKENLESSMSNPTCSSRNNNRTKKITTVHRRNATKQPTTAKSPKV
jgi:hypothetical protein